jgi:hypothetical protein
MTEPHTAARILTQVRELAGRWTPRVFSKTAWYRFSRDRRRRYVSRIPDTPTDAQAALIQSLIRLEWSALKAEAADTLLGDREGREHRRLYQKFLVDFEKSLAKPAVAERAPTLGEHLAHRAAEREAPAS